MPSIRLVDHDEVTGPDPELPAYPLEAVRPPLTKDLVVGDQFLNSILQKYDTAVPVVSWLRSRLKGNDSSPAEATTLERALAEYEDKGSDDPSTARHLLAFRFYLQEVLWRCTAYMRSDSLEGGDTNYQPLVRELMQWALRTERRVVVLNFNYDLLFETACANHWGFDLHKPGTYLSHPNFKVIKPHGSVNWLAPFLEEVRAAPRARWATESLSAGGDHYLNDEGMWGEPFPPWRPDPPTTALPDRILGAPAMAPPTADKHTFLCPPDQKAYLRDLSPGGVSQVLVIGWRAAEPHVLERLESMVRQSSRIHIVDFGEGVIAPQRALKERLADPQFTHDSEGFRVYMASNHLRSWLEASEAPRR